MSLNPKSLGPCFHLVFEQKRRYKTHFPVKYDLGTGIISFVQKGSHAEKAGLAVGDKIRDVDRKKNNMTYPVTVTLMEGKKEKIIKYMPDEAPLIKVPQFKLNQTMFKSNPEQCLAWFHNPLGK